MLLSPARRMTMELHETWHFSSSLFVIHPLKFSLSFFLYAVKYYLTISEAQVEIIEYSEIQD